MKSKTPTVSVIVPVYKAEKYLRKCLDSLLAQTFKDFELLLIDDGSPDKSGAICDEYARRDTRIHVFHKKNGGVSSARNMGLDHAQGEWIAFVDADDWVEDNYLQVFMHPQNLICCDIVHFGLQIESANGEIHTRFDFHNNNHRIVSPNYILRRGVFNSFVFTHFFRAKLITDIRFTSKINYSEDREFFFKALLKTPNSILIINNTTYRYTYNLSSATKIARTPENCFDDIEVLFNIHKFINDHKIQPSSENRQFIFRLLVSSFFYVFSRLKHNERTHTTKIAQQQVNRVSHAYALHTMETILFSHCPHVIVWKYKAHNTVRHLYHLLFR